ncbi:MAG TPA: molecular chaperone TorD family protein [Thermoanaerobaculia bacterium]|nr:molecular chaperone TorD family protein [Thermoanaerobaculia bacterium]
MTAAPRILLRHATHIGSGRPAAAAAFAGALSRALLEPPDASLRAALVAVWRDAAEWDELFAPASRLACAAEAADLDASRKEHARLFLGPNPAPCLPYESVWTEVPPLLMGRSHRDALGLYRKAGFAPRGTDPADHVGVQMGFIALLASRIAAGLDERATLEVFWARHVENWIPSFGERVARNAQCPFYRTLGAVLAEVTRWPTPAEKMTAAPVGPKEER